MGAMAIFGSYIGKDRTLTGEAVRDRRASIPLVALMAGLIIFPACFAFGVEPGSGPGPCVHHAAQRVRTRCRAASCGARCSSCS